MQLIDKPTNCRFQSISELQLSSENCVFNPLTQHNYFIVLHVLPVYYVKIYVVHLNCDKS